MDTKLDDEQLPMGKVEYKKTIRKITKSIQQELEKDLAQVLNFQEIIQESAKFSKRILDKISSKYQQNYSASYHFSMGLLSRLFNEVVRPFTGSAQTQFDSVFINEYIKKWNSIIKEYNENTQNSFIQWEAFAECIVKSTDGRFHFINAELVDTESDNVY